MQRRSFTKWLALGAGSQLLGESGETAAAEPPDAAAAEPKPEPLEAQPEDESVIVTDYEELARRKLPRATFEYISTGSDDGLTLRENIEAFRRIGLLPPILHGVERVDTSTTVLGQKISLPVLLAPVAGLRLYHPEGARDSARAAQEAGTICAVSSSACHSIEEIGTAAAGPKWYQLYMPRDKGLARALVQRAEAAGYKAIIVTVDLGERKDADRRNQFGLPREMLLKHLRDIGHKQLNGRMSLEELEAFNLTVWDPALSWDVFDWLRGITKLPLVVKGVLGARDARRAVREGVDAIVVSNHGGRRLDGMPASIDRMSIVADAVGNRAELLLDSGVRRGTDVFKALALGARAVLVGRAQAWSLAAGGHVAVSRMLGFFHEELVNAMVSCGSRNVSEIKPRFLLDAPSHE